MYLLQFSSVTQLCLTLCNPMNHSTPASLSITNSRSSLKGMSIESVMPSSHLILCRPLLLLPPIPPSIRVFSNESTLCMRWPKYWSFSFSIIPSKEHPGLISFRMDWLDLLAAQGTLKSLLQHHSSKASTLQCSAFFTGQLSHPYMTTGKTIALTAAAAKWLQSCPTLCDPIDGSPPGSPVPGILQARKNTGVGCHFPLQCIKVKRGHRGWDGWTASLTQWTWVWVNSGSWWWTGRPGVLQFMGSQRVGHKWATELNW